MHKLKAGVIGCGGIANQKHLPALAHLSDKVELTAFCDIQAERARKAAQQYGGVQAKVYENYKDLLQDVSLDVVYVLTPNIDHSYMTVEALEAGKHVMCEKPMAINSAEAGKMLEASRRTGKKLTIGYQNRYRSDAQAMYQACRSGELGDIYFAKAHAIRRRGVPTWGVFPDKTKQGGGPLIDIGTHSLDLALWCMDNYRPAFVMGSTFQKMKHKHEANAFGPWDPEAYEVEDSAFGFVKMENGATIYIESAWALNLIEPKEGQVTLCGTEAGAEMFGDAYMGMDFVRFNTTKYNQFVEYQTAPGKGGALAGAGGSDVYWGKLGLAEAENWINAILNDTEPLVKPEQAFVVTQILEAIYLSSEIGSAVALTPSIDLVSSAG